MTERELTMSPPTAIPAEVGRAWKVGGIIGGRGTGEIAQSGHM